MAQTVTNTTLAITGTSPITLTDTITLVNGHLTFNDPGGNTSAILAPTTVVQGVGSIRDNVFGMSGPNAVENKGTVRADGGTLAITTTGFTNSGVLAAAAGGTLQIKENQNSAWTNAASGTISGVAGTTVTMSGPFTSAGTVTMNGGTLNLDGTFSFGGAFTAWTNTGTISATNATVNLAGNLSAANLGTINLTNSALHVFGSHTVAALDTIDRTGGTVNFRRGTLDNSGGTLDSGDATLTGLVLDGGTIKGGSLKQASLGLTFSGHDGNTLEDVTVLGGLDVVGGRVALAGTTSIKNTAGTALAQINVTNSILGLRGDAPVTVSQTIALSNGTLTRDTTGVVAQIVIGAAGGLVKGTGVIRGDVFPFNDAMALTNQGTIRAESGNLRIEANQFTNSGVLAAAAGGTLQIKENQNSAWTNAASGTISGVAGTTVTMSGPFTSAGTVTMNGGTLNLDGTFSFGGAFTAWTNTGTISATNATVNLAGNLSAANLGTINLTNSALHVFGSHTVAALDTIDRTGGTVNFRRGTLDNSGGTLDSGDATLTGLVLDGGTIKGGSLKQASLGLTFSGHDGNTLEDVTVLGGLDVVGGRVALAGTTSIKNTAGTALAQINVTNSILGLRGDAPVTVSQTIALSNGTLTRDTTGVVAQIVIGAAGGLVKGTGVIRGDVFPFNDAMALTNQGTIRAESGNLRIEANQFTNSGVLAAAAGGTLQIKENQNSAWTNAASGTISGVAGTTVTMSGPFTSAGTVTMNGGTLNLDGTFSFGGAFTAWTNTGTISATNATVNLAGNLSAANLGTINLTNSALHVFGSHTVAALDTIDRTGGTVNFRRGTLDNSGGTLDSGDATLTGLVLDGGTIKGGSLKQASLGLTFSGHDGNTLEDVTVLGGLDVVGGRVALAGTTSIKNTAGTALDRIAVTNGLLALRKSTDITLSQTVTLDNGTLTVDGRPGAVEVPFAVAANGMIEGNGTIRDRVFPYGDTTIALANQGTIRAESGVLNIFVEKLVNHGLMEAVAGGTLQVFDNLDRAWTNAADGTIRGGRGGTLDLGGAFLNQGLISADHGTLHLDARTGFGATPLAWVNNGVITINNSTVNLHGTLTGTGAFHMSDQSTLNIFGTVAAGQTITFADATEDLVLHDPANFHATLAGFRYGDEIRLVGKDVDKVALTGNTLTLSLGGTAVASFGLVGNFAGATFSVQDVGADAIITTDAGPVYNGTLRVFGPSLYDYTGMFPALSQASSAALANVDATAVRQTYTVEYRSGIKVVYEGTGLTLGAGGAFDPEGGKVDRVMVFDRSAPGDPLKVAVFSSGAALSDKMVFPFADDVLVGGRDFYQRLLEGNNTIVGGPADDILSDDSGDNVLFGGGGINKMSFGPAVTALSVTPQDGAGNFEFDYVNFPGSNDGSGFHGVEHTGNGYKDAPIQLDKLNQLVQDHNRNNGGGGGDKGGGSKGGGKGDPHLTTFDGAWYDFMGKGEFVLAKSKLTGDTFEVQARMESYQGSSSITSITAVGVRVGADRVTVDPSRPSAIQVNGAPATLVDGVMTLTDGFVQEVRPGSYRLSLYSGETVRVEAWGGSYLNVTVSLGVGHPKGVMAGLLGNDDGDRDDDFALPDGTVLTAPLTFEQLYDTLGDAWRVNPATSLLDYGPGETPATFTDMAFPKHGLVLDDLPAEVVAQASEAVRKAGLTDPSLVTQTLLDYIVTGDVGLVAEALKDQQDGLAAASAMTPTGQPATASALGVAAVAAMVDEAASGNTSLAFTVYRTGDVNGPVSVNYAAVANGPGYFNAASFGGALPSGQVTLANGEASKTFVIQVPKSAVTLAEQRLRVEIGNAEGVPILAPNAESAILNDDPVAGLHAAPGFELLSGGFVLTRIGNAWTLDLGALAVGQAPPDLRFAVANMANGPANLLSGLFEVSGDAAVSVTGVDPFLRLAPEGIRSFDLNLDTASPGTRTKTITLHASESNASGFNAPLADAMLTVTATVGAGNPVEGTAANNILTGTLGADVISGFAGNDTIRGLPGDDILRGGSGFDTLNGGPGLDLVSAQGASGMAYVELRDAPGYFLDGGGVFDAIALIEGAIGGGGNDFLNGDDSPNVLRGGDGTDALLGRGGNDTLDGGAGERDYLMGGTAYGAAETGTGNDVIRGGAGTDVIYGMDGDDIIDGGPDADFVLAGGGGDRVDGGSGDDFLFASAAYDFNQPNAGNDTISGGDGIDFIVGGRGRDTVSGEGGNDIVYAGADDDAVSGGADNDTILGEAGADLMAGGSGFDYIYGGSGADVFDVNVGDSYDTVWDFSAAQGDKLRLDPALGVATFTQFAAKLTGFNASGVDYTVVTFDGGLDQITFGGIGPSTWTAAMVEFA